MLIIRRKKKMILDVLFWSCLILPALDVLFVLASLFHLPFFDGWTEIPHFPWTLFVLFYVFATVIYIRNKMYRCPRCGANLLIGKETILGLSQRCGDHCSVCGLDIEIKYE